MNVYAEYSFYTSKYKGRASEEEFQSRVLSASAHVRRITFGRADDCMDMEEVKLATCAVCDVLLEDYASRVNGKQISSETTDGYSVTYVVYKAYKNLNGNGMVKKMNEEITEMHFE